MFADVFWALAMAANVYLTFYRQFDITSLRKMEPLYVVLCYGVPFVPALAFIFAKNHHGARVYGDVSLWCWVTVDWYAVQVITYGVIWCVFPPPTDESISLLIVTVTNLSVPGSLSS